MTGTTPAERGEPFLLDATAFARVLELGGPQLLGRLIDLFLENAPERLARALRGAAGADLETVERATHSLKSTAGNLGARRLQLIAERIERLAAARDAAAVQPLLPELERAFETTRAALIRERKGLPS
jgi:HPt (histidine-containing phosphotransfer) domain-containing protein